MQQQQQSALLIATSSGRTTKQIYLQQFHSFIETAGPKEMNCPHLDGHGSHTGNPKQIEQAHIPTTHRRQPHGIFFVVTL
jgi:hypothetical protein